jgi:cytochrome c oxidase assembly protein subunit 15
VRGLAVANLATNVLLIVTGGAVRLTASGLGCPEWPKCTSASVVNTPELGIYGYVEFGNRTLTFVLGAVALATLVAAWWDRPRRPSVVGLSLMLLMGIPLQAVIGGITVLTDLNPWVVSLHLLLSLGLVALATVLVARTREGDGAAVALVPAAVGWLGRLVLGALAAVLYVGTVVTGSGPHAGDASAPRNGLDPAAMSQLHADLVFLLLGLSVGLWFAVRAVGAPAGARAATTVLVAVELAQGAIGFVQYFTALPIVLVGLLMLGAGLLVVATVRALTALRARPGVPDVVAPRAATEPAPATVRA